MQQSIRYTKTLGNSAIYFRLRGKGADAGKFWNFVTLAWVTPQINDCRVFATEYADNDPYDSEYATEVTVPTGGPYIVEAVLASNSEVLGTDTTAIDETISSRALDSTVAKEVTTIAASGSIINEINQIPINPLLDNDSRLNNLDRAISATLPTSGYIAPDNTTITNVYNEVTTHPTLSEIEASTIIAKEATVLTRSASGEYTSEIIDIKIQTDKLIFDNDNFVKSNPQTSIIATISTSDMDTLVDKVWDDSRTQHTSGGTMGAGIPAATMGRV